MREVEGGLEIKRSKLGFLGLAIFLMGFAAMPSARGGEAGCINCVRQGIWVCQLVARDGGDSCFTMNDTCTVTGSCDYQPPAPPPPDPTPPPEPTIPTDVWQGQIGAAELQYGEPCYPLCKNFPAIVPVAEAYDFASIRAKLAELSGKPESSIVFKARGYVASWAPSFGTDTTGFLVGGSNEGVVIRRDVSPEDGSLRVRVCRFTEGGPAELVSDQTLHESGTLLVRLTLDGHDVALAFKESLIPWSNFETEHVSNQESWADDFEANSTDPVWTISIRHASTVCE